MSRAGPIEDGQFDDAPGDIDSSPVRAQHAAPLDPRGGYNYIDDTHILDWSSEDHSSEDETYSDDDLYDEYARAEDEDWEIAERDFTKQYNRIRQHLAVQSGNASGVASATQKSTAVAALPVVNRPPRAAAAHVKDKTQDQLAALSKFSSRLSKIDVPYQMGVGVNRKGPSSYANMKDKSDRATNEQVLDPRTRIILFKMIGRGLIHEVNGCVSTGKEANVYHALTSEGAHLALKIYKTSILIFKDRDRYVSGEFRFRRGYSRRNPRKMVRLWAEKEMRNLRRLAAAGIPCPEPVEVRENVLVMTFLGDREGWASPRLKDAELDKDAYTVLYRELVLDVRTLFHQCRLVHADLSEYNILYHDGRLHIIDVSQSVEHDHPSAFDFLRNDINNIEEFFSRNGVRTMGLRRCFDFVTRDKFSASDVDALAADASAIFDQWIQETPVCGTGDAESALALATDAHEDSVFRQSYIPRSLNELYNPERDIQQAERGDGTGPLVYSGAIGTAGVPLPQGRPVHVRFDGDGDADGDDQNATERGGDDGSRGAVPDEDSGSSEGESGGDSEVETGGPADRRPRGHRHEDREVKKVCGRPHNSSV
ncbi:RIO1 family-domain-containing protein [Vararia minispora EC-137]|uniref:RIO1 family-domain-containing protein n=1 Tax=Vararia minispora EC-137 TaxID=1314806 RepID=A0ACB8QXT5_9AGAM|nr:RIO1 family-domain-containing protein [Vararia minispora EC-137]